MLGLQECLKKMKINFSLFCKHSVNQGLVSLCNGLAVKASFIGQYTRTEMLHIGLIDGLPRLGQRMGYLVCIYDASSQLAQHLGHGALATGYAAGKAYDPGHGSILWHMGQ